MPILELQQRARELGRIRLGQKGSKGQPEKLDRFRLTSPSKPLLDKVANLYGGTVKPWTPTGGAAQYEVIITDTRLPILVPPQPVSQWMESWSGGGCTRRCNGVLETIGGTACPCAAEENVICKPTTRIKVVLRDVEGIGVWRVESHGWYTASEMPSVAEFLSNAGGYVSAWLGLEERVVKRLGQPTRKFMVPTIEVDVTPAQLLAGGGAVQQITHTAEEVFPGIEATPTLATFDYNVEAGDAQDVETIRSIWKRAAESGHLDDRMREYLTRRVAEITADNQPAEVVAEIVTPDDDMQPARVLTADSGTFDDVLRAAGDKGITYTPMVNLFAERNGGLHIDSASATELAAFAAWLRSDECEVAL